MRHVVAAGVQPAIRAISLSDLLELKVAGRCDHLRQVGVVVAAVVSADDKILLAGGRPVQDGDILARWRHERAVLLILNGRGNAVLVRAGLLDIDERLQALRVGRATPTVVEARAKLSDRAIAGAPQDLTR